MKTYCKIEQNWDGTFQIVAPAEYSIFDTVCVSIEEAEMLCAMIDRIIAELEYFKSFIESLKEEEQKRVTEEREKGLKRHLDGLRKLAEEDKKWQDELMKAINKWLDDYFNKLQESLEYNSFGMRM